MKTDLLLVPFDASAANLLEAAAAAERAGFDGIWLWDHISGAVHRQEHVLECWTALTAVSAQVPRITIGPLVLNASNRHPGVVAAMAATLQASSGGRLLLSIGAGGGRDSPYAGEQRAIGRSVGNDPARRARVERSILEIKRLWSGDVPGFMRPVPEPPIVVGGFGPKMAELAGRVADGFNTAVNNPQLEELIRVARDAYAASGRSGSFEISVFAGLSDAWLRSGSRHRRKLEELGIARLILLIDPPFDPAAITEAGALLRG